MATPTAPGHPSRVIKRVLNPIISKGRDTRFKIIPIPESKIDKSFSTRFFSLPRFSDLAQYDER